MTDNTYKPVDINSINGPDLEKYLINTFEKLGWDCSLASERIHMSSGKIFSPDITLKKGDKIIGFVECYISRHDSRILRRKQEQILFIMEQLKPELFILTNGVTFETYFDNTYIGTMTFPISYSSYKEKNRILKYCKLLSENDGE